VAARNILEKSQNHEAGISLKKRRTQKALIPDQYSVLFDVDS